MTRRQVHRRIVVARGFTLIELVITVALVGVVALVSLPLYQVVATRMKESELRSALRTIRTALDAYKGAVDTGQIPRQAGESGYPPNLEVLVQGVETGVSNAVTMSGEAAPKRLVFLRRVPRDPFYPDPAVPAEQTWDTRAYGSPPDAPEAGADVFDVSSKSTRSAINGTPYRSW
jgi:general secretion pathway protein G